MDIFVDQREQLPQGPHAELEALRQAGFAVDVTTRDEWMVEAIVKQYGEETRVQWIDDSESSRRFFPAVDDKELGFRLHQADAAVNKALCAARRERAPRDAVDLVSIVHRYAPLGPLVWALAGKDPNLTPPKAISSIRRIAFGYADEEIRAVRMEEGGTVTRAELREVLGAALKAAADYCDDMAPADHVGCLFVDAEDKPVEASAITLADGTHRVITINDFGSVPKVSD